MDCEDNYIGIQHDFYHLQGTKTVVQEVDRMHFDPQPFSSYTDETDITELYLQEIFQRSLGHILKFAQDIDWVTWRRINKIFHVEYELQRTMVSDDDCKNTS